MDEELISRQQPQSLEAEQAVLGSILIDSQCVSDVIGILKPEDFYLQQNREIYEAIYTMFNFSQTIDPVTVLDKLKELGYYRKHCPGEGYAPGPGSGCRGNIRHGLRPDGHRRGYFGVRGKEDLRHPQG